MTVVRCGQIRDSKAGEDRAVASRGGGSVAFPRTSRLSRSRRLTGGKRRIFARLKGNRAPAGDCSRGWTRL
jgi:hypothetical protein